ncbi:BREX-1 system adenine-specific DNA-methyltransferase PglX [Microbacterium sp. 1S1]|nr:BREX-1 system adenine-specific DNA-methyltransferase PglX [Microbacterium sp. 1S1]
MDTKPLESFAKTARRELIAAVSAQASAVLAPGSVARTERADTVRRLESEIAAHSHEHVIDKVAYTWFNRLIALRFMDAKGYTGAGVVSPAHGQVHGQPEILANAKRGDIDADIVTSSATRDAILGLLDGTRRSTDAEGEAYALLLTEYCRYWHKSMPFMFEREGDYTELLVPAGLLTDGGIVARARNVLTEGVCDDVEVIGWLYQFYISERKDEVFAGFKKNKKAGADEIPAATQLFTPHWIVRYLVENSVGRLWMLNRPASRLLDSMDYYIEPVDEETDFLVLSGPEELSVIDPACGSGHMLTYAFDLLYAIYEEEGYAPSEIPSLILTHNIHGTEIDPRAGALAAFALTMKARAKDRRFLARDVKPSICVIEPIRFGVDEIQLLTADVVHESADEVFWNQFEHADTFGSLIQPDLGPLSAVADSLEHFDEADSLLFADAVGRARKLVRQVEVLSAKYAVVIANPPYMGSKQMNGLLSQFMKDRYPDSKSDLFASFIERCTNLAGPRGTVAMITMQSWMFLSSYEKLRASLLTKQRITSMLHLGARAFDSIGGDVVSSTAFTMTNVPPEARGTDRTRAGTFIRLVNGTSESEKATALSTALELRSKDAGFHLASDADFLAIPGSPIVYWLSERVLGAFSANKLLGEITQPREGLTSTDNARFKRQWWEVGLSKCSLDAPSRDYAANSGATWFPLNSGGPYRLWYGNTDIVINWRDDGADMKRFIIEKMKVSYSKQIRSEKCYFQPSISVGKITSSTPSFRFYPAGFVIDSASKCLYFDSHEDRMSALGVCNSPFAITILAATSPTINMTGEALASLPFRRSPVVASLARELVESAKADWNQSETSWAFASNPLVTAFRTSAL